MYYECMTVITLRADPKTQELLEQLALPGETRSDTIRRALQDSLILRRRSLMEQEATAIATDPADLAEAKAVATDMDELRAW